MQPLAHTGCACGCGADIVPLCYARVPTKGKSDDAKAIKAELATKNRMLEVIKREMASA